MHRKTQEEIAAMRPAGQLVRECHQIAGSLCKPGVTTAQIDAAVDAHIASKGGIPIFKGVPGPVPFPAATCISVNEEVVHGIPGDRVLREGDIVSVDIGASIDGWCGDSAWTYPVGETDEQKRKLLQVTESALMLAIELIPKSRFWSEVAREMERLVRRAGFSTVETLVGHGIGHQMHEDPQVPNFVSNSFLRNWDFRLLPGTVIAVEPMVNAGTKTVRVLSDGWTHVTLDGRPSAHFEHTLGITDHGTVEILTGPPAAE
ncbi:MAG: type I methionyl aminopeptidase [Planctomycetia bacterium]|nr:type I methionyl aminopeptidase [Planctomycetia bacterium]